MSRRFFKAVARAMARVFSAVSRRVPSSASTAVSPSGNVRTLGAGRRVERGGGMCAHKNGVDGARQEADTQQPNASDGDDTGGDQRRGGKVPSRKIPPNLADRYPKIVQVTRFSRR